MSRNKILFIYILKCFSGILLCSVVALFADQWIDFSWSLISVVLVLSPEGKDAVDLALTRIKANLIGAGVGLIILFSQIPTPWNMAVATVPALWICDRLKLNAAARSTLAATLIVLLRPEGKELWSAAVDRVGAVIVGCAMGLVVTYVFHSVIKVENLLKPEVEKGKDS